MKRLLLIHKTQFGYHTDCYKWCEYLRYKYIIDVVCFDSGKDKTKMDGINVHYVNSVGFKHFRGILFVLYSIIIALRSRGIIIVEYFYGCNYIKSLLPYKRMMLDIRTFSISPVESVRKKENRDIKKACRLYDYITIISEGLGKQIKKDEKFMSVLPLGAEIIYSGEKNYDSINLLYVGTFNNRNLETTILGFAKAKEVLGGVDLKYHIVGGSYNNEYDQSLKKLVLDLGLSDSIVFYGFQPHSTLTHFYRKCNVGVSFVPITEYYQYQPPTKTFEYIMAGLYTIATKTYSNEQIVNNINGCLIEDTSESFADAVINVFRNKDIVNSERIRHSLDEYQWENIVNKTLVNILSNVEREFNIK